MSIIEHVYHCRVTTGERLELTYNPRIYEYVLEIRFADKTCLPIAFTIADIDRLKRKLENHLEDLSRRKEE